MVARREAMQTETTKLSEDTSLTKSAERTVPHSLLLFFTVSFLLSLLLGREGRGNELNIK